MDVHVILITFISSGEIDRCLKKVTEGVESFEDIWQKVNKKNLYVLFYVLFIMVNGQIYIWLQTFKKTMKYLSS